MTSKNKNNNSSRKKTKRKANNVYIYICACFGFCKWPTPSYSEFDSNAKMSNIFGNA